MSVRDEDNTGTTAVRHTFDETRLQHWLRANVEGFEGPLTVEQFKGGQSNPTYKLVTPRRSYVLRRKPQGVNVKGAHAVEREARIQSALQDTGFPVARIYGLCTDDTVIGSWFYLMEMVEGRIFWDATVSGVDNDERAAIFAAMNSTIARLHSLDYQALGLADFGKPGNFFERQISRWSRQYLEDEIAGRHPTMDKLVAYMQAATPTQDNDTAITHGDFRIDNMIFHPTEPRVIAVLDWELSTLGHAGADFAFHAMMYRMPPHIVAGLASADITVLGIPSEEEYLKRYCVNSGIDGMAGYDFYVAFNFFRLAAIFHGIKARHLRGNAASAQAKERVKVLPELIELAWQQAVRAGAR